MQLARLDDRDAEINVVLVQTTSTKLNLLLYDKIKKKCNANNESTIVVESKRDLNKVKDVLGVRPPFTERWFVPIDFNTFFDPSIIDVIKSATTCVFFLTCHKYGMYKRVKQGLKGESGVYDFYISYLRRPDFLYLYDGFVHEENKLSKQLYDFTVKSYSNDVEAVMNLFVELANKRKFESRKDIASVCGIGGLSSEAFIFDFLKPISGSDKGLHKVIKNRLQAGKELGESMGFGYLYNSMRKHLGIFIELKVLMISGVVYKDASHLPENILIDSKSLKEAKETGNGGFVEEDLVKNQKYIWRLKEIPLSQLLRMYTLLGKERWRDGTYLMKFVYSFYEFEAKNYLFNLQDKGV